MAERLDPKSTAPSSRAKRGICFFFGRGAILCLAALFLSGLLYEANSAPKGPSRPRILGIAGVTLASSRFGPSQKFYGNALAFSPAETKMSDAAAGNARCDFNAEECFLTPQGQTISILSPCGAEGPCETNFLFAITLETSDATGLRDFLKSQGVAVSEPRLGGKAFTAVDPDHHRIHFVDAGLSKHLGRDEHAAASQIIHVGFVVHDRAAMDKFYKDILGFHMYWHGGMKDEETNWVDMQVPDGTDWVEYMLNVPANADKHTLGVMNHIALGVPDIHAAAKQLLTNGMKLIEEPQIGRDGKWQLNLYDPDDTRVELMEFTPVQKPCCSEYTGPHPRP